MIVLIPNHCLSMYFRYYMYITAVFCYIVAKVNDRPLGKELFVRLKDTFVNIYQFVCLLLSLIYLFIYLFMRAHNIPLF